MRGVVSKHLNQPILITGGAGYYSGLTMKELMEARNPELHDTQFVIYQGNQSEADKILGSDYQLEKSFLKNNQGIFIFKKLAYVQ